MKRLHTAAAVGCSLYLLAEPASAQFRSRTNAQAAFASADEPTDAMRAAGPAAILAAGGFLAGLALALWHMRGRRGEYLLGTRTGVDMGFTFGAGLLGLAMVMLRPESAADGETLEPGEVLFGSLEGSWQTVRVERALGDRRYLVRDERGGAWEVGGWALRHRTMLHVARGTTALFGMSLAFGLTLLARAGLGRKRRDDDEDATSTGDAVLVLLAMDGSARARVESAIASLASEGRPSEQTNGRRARHLRTALASELPGVLMASITPLPAMSRAEVSRRLAEEIALDHDSEPAEKVAPESAPIAQGAVPFRGGAHAPGVAVLGVIALAEHARFDSFDTSDRTTLARSLSHALAPRGGLRGLAWGWAPSQRGTTLELSELSAAFPSLASFGSN